MPELALFEIQMKFFAFLLACILAGMFMLMPIMFTFLLANFAAGLVIYWAWSNTLSIAQQWVIMRRHGGR